MKTTVLGLLAETPVHPGSGRSLGVVDLPVAREAATDYPVLVGSSLKGALRDRAEQERPKDHDFADHWFGRQEHAGRLLVTDARLVALPVRSLTGASQWVTCPQLLERLARDLARAGDGLTGPFVPELAPGHAYATADGTELYLEERQFTVDGSPPDGIVPALAPLLAHPEVRDRLAQRLVVVHDEDFGWFARFGLPVNARNQLDDETKASENLWYEETLPPDTVMYALVAARRRGEDGEDTDDPATPLAEIFPEEDRYLQAGGNETVGHGWFAVTLLPGSGLSVEGSDPR